MPGTKPLITYTQEAIEAIEKAHAARERYLQADPSDPDSKRLEDGYHIALSEVLRLTWKDLNRYRVGTP